MLYLSHFHLYFIFLLKVFTSVNGSIDFSEAILAATYNIDLIYQRYEFYKSFYQFHLGSSNMNT